MLFFAVSLTLLFVDEEFGEGNIYRLSSILELCTYATIPQHYYHKTVIGV